MPVFEGQSRNCRSPSAGSILATIRKISGVHGVERVYQPFRRLNPRSCPFTSAGNRESTLRIPAALNPYTKGMRNALRALQGWLLLPGLFAGCHSHPLTDYRATGQGRHVVERPGRLKETQRQRQRSQSIGRP